MTYFRWRSLKKPSKYNAKSVVVDGIRFHSRLEADYYTHLCVLRQAGEIAFFLMQVPFALPGATRYIVDFAIFWTDGRVSFVDVKGVETETFKLKKRQVEALYPIEIEIIKKGGF